MNRKHTSKNSTTLHTLKIITCSLGICAAVLSSSGLLRLATTDREQRQASSFQTFEPITQSIEQMIARGLR